MKYVQDSYGGCKRALLEDKQVANSSYFKPNYWLTQLAINTLKYKHIHALKFVNKAFFIQCIEYEFNILSQHDLSYFYKYKVTQVTEFFSARKFYKLQHIYTYIHA